MGRKSKKKQRKIKTDLWDIPVIDLKSPWGDIPEVDWNDLPEVDWDLPDTKWDIPEITWDDLPELDMLFGNRGRKKRNKRNT